MGSDEGAPHERPLPLVPPPPRVSPAKGRSSRLKIHLDRFLDEFPYRHHVGQDPVLFVRRYSESVDREIVGFVASALSYGNVKAVLTSVEAVISRMGPHPAAFVLGFDPNRDGSVFKGFQHRWNNGTDVSVLLWILRRFLEEYGSVEKCYGRRPVIAGTFRRKNSGRIFLKSPGFRARAVLFEARP